MAAASPSRSDPSRRQYNVFLSFRGEDTRHSFTCYLHDFHRRKGINAFIDEEHLRGNDLSGILERIEQSKISIVVFSENYANSAWCLEELTKIIECKESFDQVVLPVFYKVSTSDVRHQTGKFGAPFERSKEVFQGSEHRVPAWKEALRAASDIAGYVLPERREQTLLTNRMMQHEGLVLEPLSGVSFPGNDLALWFRHQRMGSSMETHLPPHWCDDKFIGLSLCAVVAFKDYEDKTSRFSVICKCKFRNKDGGCISFTCNLGGWKEQCGSSSQEEEPRRLRSDHVFISYNNCYHAKKSHDLNRCCNTTASFKFFVTDGVAKRKLDCCEVVKCGMSLLYAPDENDYRLQGLQENNLEKAVYGKETDLNETDMDEAVVSKRGRFCLQEEELLNGEKNKRRNLFC